MEWMGFILTQLYHEKKYKGTFYFKEPSSFLNGLLSFITEEGIFLIMLRISCYSIVTDIYQRNQKPMDGLVLIL